MKAAGAFLGLPREFTHTRPLIKCPLWANSRHRLLFNHLVGAGEQRRLHREALADILRSQGGNQCASLRTRAFESGPQVALRESATWNCFWQTSKWIRLLIMQVAVGSMSD